jgi:hypothetical protein
MRNRVIWFAGATLVGGLIGYVWNTPVFYQMYKGFIALFQDPAAPFATASAAIGLAFIMGVPRICVP